MIILLLTSKNEGDLLRRNIEHHLRWGVDHVCVADNTSTDETPEIVRSFGDAASSVVFGDFGKRQGVRTDMFRRMHERRGGVDWAGVSDTDEFWWAPGANARELLATVPADVPAATFEQKLFLPTELDGASGGACERMIHRASGPSSPLFTSYHGGKTFYRGASLRRVTHEHRNPDVGAPEWRHPVPAVHHYMIEAEDQFVIKVSRFQAWRPRRWPASAGWYVALMTAVGARPAPALKSVSKQEWWQIFATGGESALREYYRTKLRLGRADVERRLASGDLVRDAAFADYCAARHPSPQQNRAYPSSLRDAK